MWNNCSHYLHQISQPSTPRSANSYDQKTLSPRVRFPHIYRADNLDLSLQLPQPPSPRFSYGWASPRGVYPPTHYTSIGSRFGLVPATPRSRVVAEEGGAGPLTLEAVGGLSVSCNDSYKTRGIGIIGDGPVDGGEGPLRMERFKIRTVDIDEMLVLDEK